MCVIMADKNTTKKKTVDDSEQQTVTPEVETSTTSTQPTLVGTPAKNSKKKLIIGIVVGVSTLIALIVAVVLYFVWYQNPTKVVNDGLVGLLTSKTAQYSFDGSASGSNGNSDVKIKADFVRGESASGGTVDLKLKLRDVDDEVVVKADVYMDKEAVYYRVHDLEKVIDAMIDDTLNRRYYSHNTRKNQVKVQMKAQYTKIIEAIDNKWVKNTKEYLSRNNQNISGCFDAIVSLQYDQQERQNLASLYQKYPKMIDVEKLDKSSSDGTVGYTITKGDEDQAKAASDELKDSKVGQLISKCSLNSTRKVTYTYRNGTRITKRTTTSRTSIGLDNINKNSSIELWVSLISHQVKRIVIVPKKGNNSPLNITIGNKAQPAKPTDAVSGYDVEQIMKKDYSPANSSTNTDTSGEA